MRGKLLNWLILGLVSLGFLWGCGLRDLARGDLQPPRATLQGVQIGRPSAAGWPLRFTVLLENPNPQELRLLGYDFELFLAGEKAVSGASEATALLPARGQSVVKAPVLVKVPEIIGLLPVLLNQDRAVPYKIRGSLRLTSLLGGLRTPFQFQGTITPREGLDDLEFFLKNKP